jgi:hypothetical protein
MATTNTKHTFKFIGVKDCGETCCPHCGADGRYIYTWEMDGVVTSAMAGCFKELTGRMSEDEESRYWVLLAEKQVKNKPLNGWDKSILRMLEFKQSGKYPSEWCDNKINETLRDRKIYLAKKR